MIQIGVFSQNSFCLFAGKAEIKLSMGNVEATSKICGSSPELSDQNHVKSGRTFFTTDKTYGFPSLVLYAPTPRLTF